MEFRSILYTNILKVGECAILKWKSFWLFIPLLQYDLGKKKSLDNQRINAFYF